jgi:hypothetical protein
LTKDTWAYRGPSRDRMDFARPALTDRQRALRDRQRLSVAAIEWRRHTRALLDGLEPTDAERAARLAELGEFLAARIRLPAEDQAIIGRLRARAAEH